ncbi:piggyBac transposable element-derived protein 4, partial [Anoplophora glabripennis]|uniref:piggyBac transposable element-derived protein 4 n=1 Tax=Anoplophora glabripennis TaxID=217634 RepID=UPI0008750C22
MADDIVPGPSGFKRPRIRNPKQLTDEELLALAYFSDSDEEPFEDSGSEWSGEEVAEEFAEYADESDNPESDPEPSADEPIIVQQNDNMEWVENPPMLKNIPFVGQKELKVPIPGDESNGTVLNMQIYTGVCDDLGGKGHAANVVLRLMTNYCDKGHSLYMDNYYNSVTLARQLLDKNTYCTGTLRAGRKETPHDVSKAKPKTGEFVHRYGGNVCVGKWKDKRE